MNTTNNQTETQLWRLIDGISDFLGQYSPGDALNVLREEFGFTDDEIKTIGNGVFDYLFDFENEEEE